jgi:methionyl-tRNA formyltransferase
MRIVILTSSRKGTASVCLPVILERTSAEVVQVIYNEGLIKNKWKHYRRKAGKMLRIGLPGALNGIRIRKWFAVNDIDGKEVEDIEAICRKHNIPFDTTPGINTQRTIDLMTGSRADLGLSLGNSYISPKVFRIPFYGMLNIHGEVLPQFQNAQSVIWQIYEGSRYTGYTIHMIDKKIDTGEILRQERFPILFKETLKATVSATCAEIVKRSAIGLGEVIGQFEVYHRQRKPQGEGKNYTTPSFGAFLKILRNFKKLKNDPLQPEEN